MKAEKLRIIEEISIRQKEITQIQSEIVTLWGRYYALNEEESSNKKKDDE